MDLASYLAKSKDKLVIKSIIWLVSLPFIYVIITTYTTFLIFYCSLLNDFA